MVKKRSQRKRINHKEIIYKYGLLTYLMDKIPDVVYFKDKNGRLVLVNNAYAKGFGLKPKDVIGKTDYDLFPEEKADMMIRDDMYVMKTGKPVIDKIERSTAPDGADNYVSTTKIPKYDVRGNIAGIVGITRDITRRMQYEHLKEKNLRIEKRLEALEELGRMKSVFISAVSHELRTPLAIIKQLIMLVSNETIGPINDKQKEALARTQSNIERLKRIIDELLDMSRIDSGTLKLHYSLVDLNELIINSSDFFKKAAEEKNLRLDYDLPKKKVNLFIDADRINQAMSNLIDNAVKFTEPGGEIKVELKVFQAKVRMGVMDTGIGISKSDLSALFDKFIQVSKIPDAERKGIGLGLSLTKEWIKKHGGEIWVESKPGTGSKFYFTLPRFYEPDILDKRIKERINGLLAKGMPLCIIDLSFANYREFKERLKIKPEILFVRLKTIINETLSKVWKLKKERPEISLTDGSDGRYYLVFPGAEEKAVNELGELLRDNIKAYFVKEKIENVFVTLGILSYPRNERVQPEKHLPANIHIKKINIGLEKRRFKRVLYEIDITFLSHEEKPESAQVVDISIGGICFMTNKLLETDSKINIKMALPVSRKNIFVKARIVWIKKAGQMTKKKRGKYEVGLEFVKVSGRNRNAISKEFKL